MLFTALLLALAVSSSHGTSIPCMALSAEEAMISCSVEDILNAIVDRSDYADLQEVSNHDIGEADIGTRLGKAAFLKEILLVTNSDECAETVADLTGVEEDNYIEDPEVDEPGIDGDQDGAEVQPSTGEDEEDTGDEDTGENTGGGQAADIECYTREDGGDYFGTVSVTESGFTCQMWSERSPHRPVKKYRGYGNNIMFPSHFGAHNHCRTLGFSDDPTPTQLSSRTGAWCYIIAQAPRWDYCTLPERQETCVTTNP